MSVADNARSGSPSELPLARNKMASAATSGETPTVPGCQALGGSSPCSARAAVCASTCCSNRESGARVRTPARLNTARSASSDSVSLRNEQGRRVFR